MSLDNTTPPIQPNKGKNQASLVCTDGRKTSALKPPEQTLKCPRCDSPNTKFCYYNNYSLTQPRHFCKTCRRYWTKGGALRNVPIGGGCRKSKKTTRSSSASNSRFFNGDSSNKDSSLDIGGLSLFTGLSPPAMDFQFPSTSNNPPNYITLDPLGFNFPLMKQNHQHQLHGGLASFQELGITNNLASSIESLSSMNQDLHLKLQQQRLVSLLGSRGGQETDEQNQIVIESQPAQKLQPILFHNLEVSRPLQTTMASDQLRKVGDGSGGGGLATEWFFEDNYAPVNVNPTAAILGPTDSNIAGNYQTGTINNWNNNGIQGWSEFNDQYGALP